MTLKPIRTYAVTVLGWPPILYSARSASKARATGWRDYLNYDDRCQFKRFLGISTVRRAPDPPGIGARALVAGKPATRVVQGTQGTGDRLLFMYDDGDIVVRAHPSEVREIATIAVFGSDKAPAVRSERSERAT